MRTGLMFLPFSVVMVVWAVVVSRLVQKVNPGILAGIGGLVAACAVFGMSRMPYDDAIAGGVGVDISYAKNILPFIMLMPVGMGLMFISNTMSVLHRVSPADGGTPTPRHPAVYSTGLVRPPAPPPRLGGHDARVRAWLSDPERPPLPHPADQSGPSGEEEVTP